MKQYLRNILVKFVLDIRVSPKIIKYQFVRRIFSFIPRPTCDLRRNVVLVNGKYLFLSPLCASSSFIWLCSRSNVSVIYPDDLKNIEKIDAVLDRSYCARVQSGFTKKYLNPNTLSKAIAFSQFNLPLGLGFKDFVIKLKESKLYRTNGLYNDKHFIETDVLLDKIGMHAENYFYLEDGLAAFCEFVDVPYCDDKKLSSNQMKVRYKFSEQELMFCREIFNK
jgi:hypothetical protein